MMQRLGQNELDIADLSGGSQVHGNVRVLSVDVRVLFCGKIYSEKSMEKVNPRTSCCVRGRPWTYDASHRLGY